MPKQSNALLRAIASAQKLKLSSKARIESFVLHVYLVILGVRDGYLVDEFCLDTTSMVTLLESFISIFGISEGLLLICLATGDFIIANPDSILRKSETSWLVDNHLVVDISSAEPHLVDDTSAIQACLGAILHGALTACRSLKDDNTTLLCHVTLALDDSTIIGYEFLAGFLLGYACIYNCPMLQRGGVIGGALSMQPLIHTALSLRMTCIGLTNTSPLMIQEFTTPECVLVGDIYDRRRGLVASSVSRISNSIAMAAAVVGETVSISAFGMNEQSITSACLNF